MAAACNWDITRCGIADACTVPNSSGFCPAGTFADAVYEPAIGCCPAPDEESCVNLDLFWSFSANTCSTGGGTNPGVCTGEGTLGGGGNFEPNGGEGSTPPDDMGCSSPVLVDVNGDGFALTDAAGGVLFDLNGNGQLDGRLAWTAAGSDDAWLALDRDGDGRITSGRELFGNFTAQPPSPAPHGFLALAEFDRPQHGGNSDGAIDARDAVFAHLRLWRDANHDGFSSPDELHTLRALDVTRIHLNYKESKRTDEHGNRFRYRAKLDDARGAKVNRWTWDVFLVTQ